MSEAEAEELSGLIELRKAVGAAQTLTGSAYVKLRSPLPRKIQRPPVRSVAIERRRRLAASGPMPPALAARFTTGEAAVLRIVGDECRDKGRCVLPLDAIAARAGVGRTTAQNALRLARRLGMIEIEERRLTGAKNLPNRVTVIDREWRQWLTRGPKGIGFKNLSTTEINGFRKGEAVAASQSRLPPGSGSARQRQTKPRAQAMR
ncbi:hypothetical protein [Methylobacterium oxalidis]|uniref:hypothetical protein n=1 Tax=Methylobacterium oxalidis TaxID=944322 RepID=UPI00158080F5|nr:hypothetical protein [Methylobacterium oxalidis]